MLLFGSAAQTRAQLQLDGHYSAHDPSRIIKDGNTYFTFTTGPGVPCLVSTNLREWSQQADPKNEIFKQAPQWTLDAVPGGLERFFWAPDVAYFNGKYHVYYSYSEWASNDSVIGLVTSPSLIDPLWTDQGKVVQSDPEDRAGPNTDYTNLNCIDASLLVDTNGDVWMAFGSYMFGIAIVQIDPSTGKRLNKKTTIISNSSGGDWSGQEGAGIFKHGNYYYLFVNQGSCCKGVDSTYYMRVGRSTSPTGPYLDKNGVSMADGGGTTLLESTGRFIGPGHAEIFQEDGRYFLSYHYYDGVNNGAPTLGIREVTWSADGWPVPQGDWQASYPFDIDARDQNGAFNGTLENGASVVDDATRGKVLNLSGSDQHVMFPLSVGNCRTITAWVKWNGGPAYQRIFDFGGGTNNYMFLTPAAASGKLRFAIKGGGAEQILEGPAALPVNQWCHVAVTLGADNKGTLYLNAAPVASGTIDIPPWDLLSRNLYLGKSQFADDPYFSGRIDDFRVYGRALSGGEIAEMTSTKVGGISSNENSPVVWISSTADKPWQNMPEPVSGAPEAAPTVRIDPDKTYQTIDGFGGCFNELGWVALGKASDSDRKDVLSALFSDEGCAFTRARLPIGASDFALDWYSLAEESGDYELKSFSIERDKRHLLPFVKAAMEVRPDLQCWGSPWSPPQWMKVNDNYSAGSIKSDPKILATYANYFVRWIEAYRKEGVNVYGVTPQNEPNMTNIYPTCDWSADQLREFIGDYLGPTLREKKANVELWLGLNGDPPSGGDDPDYRLKQVPGDPKVRRFLTGIAFQYDSRMQTCMARKWYPDLKLMQSETVCHNGDNTWGHAETLFALMKSYFDCGANAYFMWNMVLDETGNSTWGWRQNAPITVNSKTGMVTYNGEYYVMRHFSHFVKPGAKRVHTEGAWDDKIAFLNPDGSTVLVIGNAREFPLDVRIAVAGSGDVNSIDVRLPANSMNTFVVPAGK